MSTAKTTSFKNYEKLRQYILPYRPSIYIGFLFLLLSNFAVIAIPLLLRSAVDELKSGTGPNGVWRGFDMQYISWLVVMIVVLAILQAALKILSQVNIFNASRRVEHTLRSELFAHLCRLPIPFYQRTSTGHLMTSITNDMTYIRLMYGIGIFHGLNVVTNYAFTLPAILSINVTLALMIIVTYPLIYMTSRQVIRRIYQYSKYNQEVYGDMSSALNETVAGIRSLKSHNALAYRQQIFSQSADKYLKSSLKLTSFRLLFTQLMQVSTGFGMVFILGYGGSLVVSGKITLGDLVAFSAYLGILTWPTIVMGWVIPSTQRGLAAFDRVQDILQEAHETEVTGSLEEGAKDDFDGSLRIERVSFSYPKGDDSQRFRLDDISLHIKKGAKVLITGPTGAGKSTLLKLISGLYNPTSGQIFFGRRSNQEVPQTLVRQAVAYCPQDAFVFSRSLEENILFANEPKLDVNVAARISALATDEKQFYKGWQTMVGEQGVTLSGGQRQRTALARALAKGSTYLLLDDPIAQLDGKTASSVWQQIVDHFPDTTVILVSQRMTRPESFDQIFVLDQGELVEAGTHTELMAKQGLYHQHALLQQLSDEAS